MYHVHNERNSFQDKIIILISKRDRLTNSETVRWNVISNYVWRGKVHVYKIWLNLKHYSAQWPETSLKEIDMLST